MESLAAPYKGTQRIYGCYVAEINFINVLVLVFEISPLHLSLSLSLSLSQPGHPYNNIQSSNTRYI